MNKTTNYGIDLIKKYALEDGFTENEIENCTLDGFDKMTQSKRIKRLIKLAYYKGWIRGVKTSEELHSHINLS